MRELAARVLLSSAGIALLLLLWEFGVAFKWVNPALLPAPSETAVSLAGLLGSGDFAAPLFATLSLLALGYLLACVLGIGVGLLMGRSQRAFCLLEPLVEAVRPIPKPALIPIFFLFMGPGLPMNVTMVALAAFFPILINTLQGVRGVDRVLLDTARTLGLPASTVICKIVLPAALPMILAGMRVSLGLGLVLVILGEMLGADSGIGFQVLDLQRSFQVKQMYSWIFILAFLGLSLNAVFEWFERRAVPWRAR